MVFVRDVVTYHFSRPTVRATAAATATAAITPTSHEPTRKGYTIHEYKSRDPREKFFRFVVAQFCSKDIEGDGSR
jgi:hypothetical protein